MAEVEVVKVQAIPTIIMTGLAGDVVKESRERVVGSLSTLGFTEIPTGRLLIHLVPAAEKKQGSHFDLAIAMAILAIEKKLPAGCLKGWAALGELTLDGKIRAISNVVSLAEPLIQDPQVSKLIVPKDNENEISLLESEKIFLAENISQLIAHLSGSLELSQPTEPKFIHHEFPKNVFAHISGQGLAKRALQISIAGQHHLLLIGSPGIGKSLLASEASRLQPPLSRKELVEILRCHNDSLGSRLSFQRPFRSPHHSISAGAFLGGGSGTINPGEITLAHRGVLFLDEFPEFRRDAIEGLREPLETGAVHLHRVGRQLILPACFTLIAAMNPCPCGYSLEKNSRCNCSREKLNQYSKRISGPILDRIDLSIVLESSCEANEHDTRQITDPLVAVMNALERQRHRYRDLTQVERNGNLPWGQDWALMEIPDQALNWIRVLSPQRHSLRMFHKMMRVARTIADMNDQERVTRENIHEAWDLRCRLSSNSLIAF